MHDFVRSIFRTICTMVPVKIVSTVWNIAQNQSKFLTWTKHSPHLQNSRKLFMRENLRLPWLFVLDFLLVNLEGAFSAIHEILDPLIANISNLDLPDCTSFFLPTNMLKNMPNEVFGAERAIRRILNRSDNCWNKFLVCDNVNILKRHSNRHVLYVFIPRQTTNPTKASTKPWNNRGTPLSQHFKTEHSR